MKVSQDIIDAINRCIEELEENQGWNYVYGSESGEDIPISSIKAWLKSLYCYNH